MKRPGTQNGSPSHLSVLALWSVWVTWPGGLSLLLYTKGFTSPPAPEASTRPEAPHGRTPEPREVQASCSLWQNSWSLAEPRQIAQSPGPHAAVSSEGEKVHSLQQGPANHPNKRPHFHAAWPRPISEVLGPSEVPVRHGDSDWRYVPSPQTNAQVNTHDIR